MKITEILNDNKIHISFEVFPPKDEENFESFKQILNTFAHINPKIPDFISVTYGAAGGSFRLTPAACTYIQSLGVPALAHLTCINTEVPKLIGILAAYKDLGIENILALRGDIVEKEYSVLNYQHASWLMETIKDIYPEACIGGACYPEKHPEAESKQVDIKNLLLKQQVGCEFLISQMFFDNANFYNFLYRAREQGVTIPIIPGIMPILSKKSLDRALSLTNCLVPQRLISMVDTFGNDPEAMFIIGVNYALEQIFDLVSNGIKHIHIYTLNNVKLVETLLQSLPCILNTEF